MKVLHGRLYGRFYCVLYTFPPPAHLLLLLCRLPLSQVSPDDPDLPDGTCNHSPLLLHRLLLPQDALPPGIPSDIFSANLFCCSMFWFCLFLKMTVQCTLYISRLTCPLMEARAALFLEVSPKNLRLTIPSILPDLLCNRQCSNTKISTSHLFPVLYLGINVSKRIKLSAKRQL